MSIGLSTPFSFRSVLRSTLQVICCLLMLNSAMAQTITIPGSNDNDTSTRKPFGCFYWYERTNALYTSSEMGGAGYITKVAFYLNSVNSPAESTPIVIKMKNASGNSITAATYDDASFGADTVYTGNITDNMLVPNSWITIDLPVAFNYTGTSLEVFIETNLASSAVEPYNGKQFRHSETPVNRCQYWEDDFVAPTDLGVLTDKRPNIQLTFQGSCSGTPNPGVTLTTQDTACANEVFTLSMENIGTVPGMTYQWKSSTTGSSYTPIAGATEATYTTSLTQTTYYQCEVTCSSNSATSDPVKVVLNPFYHCYCSSGATDESDTKIDEVSIGTLTSTSDAFTCETYTDYTSLPAPDLSPNQPYTLHIKNGSCSGDAYGAYVAAWIDFNHSSAFDFSELVYAYGPITELNSIPDYTFFIPVTAAAGITGMRVVISEGDVSPASCGSYTFGETEDYLVNIPAVAACTGTPDPVTTLSSDTSVCLNELFTLSLSSYQSATNITYQWQYGFSLTGSYFDILGATGPTYTPPTGQIIATYYRCTVTCTSSGGGSIKSASVFVNMAPFYSCYCASAAIYQDDTKIDTVKIGTIVAGSLEDQCETYTDNTSMVTNLTIGDVTPITIRNGSCTGQFNDCYVAVYIDYNGDKDFIDGNELVYSYADTTGINTIPIGMINVPSSVDSGITGLRIVLSEVDTIPGPCGLYDYGETEDYAVHLILLPPCQSPPDAGIATSSIDSLCNADAPVNVTLNLINYSSGTGQTYQWQSSPDNNNYTDISGTTPTTTALVSQSTWYRCLVTCSGNTQPSEPVFVNVKPTPAGNLPNDPFIISSTPYTNDNNNLSSNCYTSDYVGDNEQASPDVFYKITISDSIGKLYISTCNTTDLNTYIHLLDNNGVQKGVNDNNGVLCSTSNKASLIYDVATVPSTFYIVVEGHDTDEGAYTLEVEFIPDSPDYVIAIPNLQDPLLKIFPNPADRNFTLGLDAAGSISGNATVKIYNAIGQMVTMIPVDIVQGKVTEEIKLDESFTDGIYLVELSMQDRSWTNRLLLQH